MEYKHRIFGIPQWFKDLWGHKRRGHSQGRKRAKNWHRDKQREHKRQRQARKAQWR
jgi:hypothetical protein